MNFLGAVEKDEPVSTSEVAWEVESTQCNADIRLQKTG